METFQGAAKGDGQKLIRFLNGRTLFPFPAEAGQFKLQKMTAEDLSKDEITYFLKAIETDRVNPDHDPPAKLVASYFVFLRQTGKHPEVLESPRQFARQIIWELFH